MRQSWLLVIVYYKRQLTLSVVMPRWDVSTQHEYQSVRRDWINNQANLRSSLFIIIYLLIIAPTEITQVNERLSISTFPTVTTPSDTRYPSSAHYGVEQNHDYDRFKGERLVKEAMHSDRRIEMKKTFTGPITRAKARIMAETGQVRNNSPHPPYFELQIYKP